jgi:hypothetical protein
MLSEEREAARVPTAETTAMATMSLFLNVEASTGRTDEGTGAAAETTFGLVFPYRTVESILQMFSHLFASELSRYLGEGRLFVDRLGSLLEERRLEVDELLAFLRHHLHEGCTVGEKSEKDITSFGISRTTANRGTEAILVTFVASKSHQCGLRMTGIVQTVLIVPIEDGRQRSKSHRIARTRTPDDGLGISIGRHLRQFRIFSLLIYSKSVSVGGKAAAFADDSSGNTLIVHLLGRTDDTELRLRTPR